MLSVSLSAEESEVYRWNQSSEQLLQSDIINQDVSLYIMRARDQHGCCNRNSFIRARWRRHIKRSTKSTDDFPRLKRCFRLYSRLDFWQDFNEAPQRTTALRVTCVKCRFHRTSREPQAVTNWFNWQLKCDWSALKVCPIKLHIFPFLNRLALYKCLLWSFSKKMQTNLLVFMFTVELFFLLRCEDFGHRGMNTT